MRIAKAGGFVYEIEYRVKVLLREKLSKELCHCLFVQSGKNNIQILKSEL